VATSPKITLDDLIAHPDRAHSLDDAQLRDTLKQIAEQTSALKALETQILSRLVFERTLNTQADRFPTLLNAEQLAEHLGVPESWVREQARIGHLPSIKLGHYVRFRLDDVQRYLHQPIMTHLINAAGDEEELNIIHRMRDEEETWPQSKNYTDRNVLEESVDVLTAWTTVLWAHAVHANGFFSRLRRRLKSTSCVSSSMQAYIRPGESPSTFRTCAGLQESGGR
jgi:excisionase family DNA binding protein